MWFSTRVVGLNTLRKTVGKLLKSAKLDGFFTNHSLRRTGTTRFLQAGVDRKLVKEFTGHRSDAVDQYQMTSDTQREQMSEILQQKPTVSTSTVTKLCENSTEANEIKEKEGTSRGSDQCQCKCQNVKIGNASEVANLIHEIVSAGKGSKTKLKIEVEFCSE